MLNTLPRKRQSGRRTDRNKNRVRRSRLSLELLEPRTVLSGGPFFTGIGDLPGGEYESTAKAISDDGLTVVGHSYSGAAADEAYRWTLADGMTSLGFLAGSTISGANDVSADGSVIVGHSNNGGTEAFRWTATTGMVELPNATAGQSGGSAWGVSNDGNIVVGYLDDVGSSRWDIATGELLILNPFGSDPAGGRALAVSGDGTTVVGHTSFASHEGVTQAFRWTEETGSVGLGTFGDEVGIDRATSMAHAVSYDGDVVVGHSRVPLKGKKYTIGAFRWTETNGLENLGDETSTAYAVSGDGSIVAGSGDGAFIWDAANGSRNLQQLLIDEYGLETALAGWDLTIARDITADGSTIVGDGINPQGNKEGWIAHLAPVPGITVSPSSGLETSEDTTTDTFDVVLDSQPTDDVTIGVASSDTSEGTVDKSSLTFTAANWNVPQSVTVTGVDDAAQDGNQQYVVELAPAVSADASYNGLDATNVLAMNLDNEPPAGIEIYIADISFDSRRGGKDWRAVVDVLTVNGDAPVEGVTLNVDFNGATYTVTTDSDGTAHTSWQRKLADGNYLADAYDLALEGFVWNPLAFDLEDDSDGDGKPDDVLVV